jgi:hypothetical protein
MKQFLISMIALLCVSTISLSSAANIIVEKRLPVWWEAYGPFAITVTCADESVHNFSLAGGQTGAFSYPDETAIDCSISETLTESQESLFTFTVGDTWGDEDGQIDAENATLVDGQTMWVSNRLRSWGTPSSINSSTASSIPTQNDNDDTNSNNSSTDTGSNDLPRVSVGLEDPYTCGAGFIWVISSDDIANTIVTIDLQQQGQSVKILTPAVNAQGVYSQSINYTDILSPIYVAAGSYDVIVTAEYQGVQDSVTFSADITNTCDEESYIDILRERNADIIAAQSSDDSNDTPMQPVAPKKLPNTGAEIL